MAIINIPEAKAQFAQLVDAVAQGEEVIIAKAGKPAARLVPVDATKIVRRPGSLKGKIRIADDFDAPLPADIQAAFEGK